MMFSKDKQGYSWQWKTHVLTLRTVGYAHLYCDVVVVVVIGGVWGREKGKENNAISLCSLKFITGEPKI